LRKRIDSNQKERIELKGKTIHSWSFDGSTPTAFQGYECIAKDGLRYHILERGQLVILNNENGVIFKENGIWN